MRFYITCSDLTVENHLACIHAFRMNVCSARVYGGALVLSGSIAQAFGGEHHWTRGPTAAEFRAMSYLGLVRLQSIARSCRACLQQFLLYCR